MSKHFKYYYDLMSQPSRALWIALKMGKTQFEDCPIALRKKEQYTEAFKKINRFQKVPAIVDNGFHLSESVAILRYLADKQQFSKALYPRDIQERAKVDEFLEWQHLGLRYGCSHYFLHLWLLPFRGVAAKPTKEKAQELKIEMEHQLKILEELWLKDNNFVVGNKLTVADLFGACEIEQIKLCRYDIKEKFPNITKWLERVREESNPCFDEAHKYLYKAVQVLS
uniref:Glutathione S-transferase theta class 1 n=1 Tax=Glossina brevipalpis TaxID=37001 RepID=A0A1A9W9V7_9MUSC